MYACMYMRVCMREEGETRASVQAPPPHTFSHIESIFIMFITENRGDRAILRLTYGRGIDFSIYSCAAA